jgi:NADH:ubiquinone oxidoreductase subunit E
MFLRQVCLDGVDYFYLFHTETIDGSLYKYKKYIGTKKPSLEILNTLKSNLKKQIKQDPTFQVQEEKTNIIYILQDIQKSKGFISTEDFIKLSKEMAVPLTDLVGVATFYSQFKLKKPGKYQVSVCNGTACHVKGSPAIMKQVQEFLKLKPGQTSSDGKFSLESVNCIGACARAPAMMINGVVYGELDKKKMLKVIGGLK